MFLLVVLRHSNYLIIMIKSFLRVMFICVLSLNNKLNLYLYCICKFMFICICVIRVSVGCVKFSLWMVNSQEFVLCLIRKSSFFRLIVCSADFWTVLTRKLLFQLFFLVGKMWQNMFNVSKEKMYTFPTGFRVRIRSEFLRVSFFRLIVCSAEFFGQF